MSQPIVESCPSPKQAARQLLRPFRQLPSLPIDFGLGARRLSLDGPDGRIVGIELGGGPTVLLVHGWEGRASDLTAFAAPLVAAGQRVVAIDLPAHGGSDGEIASIPSMARALAHVQPQLGPVRAVIAHSIGCAVTVAAIIAGFAVERVALISAPAEYETYALLFARRLGLDRHLAGQMIEHLLTMGVDVRALSLPRIAAGMDHPALFVHSTDDQLVPVTDGQRSAELWPGARFERVEGLGHRRLLQDAGVVSKIASFVLGEIAN